MIMWCCRNIPIYAIDERMRLLLYFCVMRLIDNRKYFVVCSRQKPDLQTRKKLQKNKRRLICFYKHLVIAALIPTFDF